MKTIGITKCKTIKYNEIHNNRYLGCADYDDCLSEAVRRDMQSFHCNNCHAFQEFKKASEEYLTYTSQGKVIQRFRPGHIDLNKKNEGTLWND